MDTKDNIITIVSFILTLSLNVAIYGGIAYIIYHFISKWW